MCSLCLKSAEPHDRKLLASRALCAREMSRQSTYWKEVACSIDCYVWHPQVALMPSRKDAVLIHAVFIAGCYLVVDLPHSLLVHINQSMSIKQIDCNFFPIVL